ncbi:substrate-binding periplasmic protein [Arsukibacterium sp.]|uniref:substrate-binding periplasmic protein n=1 Tax=Arsukibacterium sp. TaxID=1977258 RepID=UPI00299CEAA2|nr:transporter substrate-binding domain-containing protein [Arsukibacterium sp.]MDX1676711.1 transporter substrate-binding domain-containing protein [Arsukibacterium sp.]
MRTALIYGGLGKLMTVLLACSLFLPGFGYSLQAKTLRVAVADYPPYTYVQDQQMGGEGYQAFEQIMNELGIQYRAEAVPNFGRSLIEMENNQLDALLLATESPERNALAQYSMPLFFTDWSWVWLAKRHDLQPGSADFKNGAIVSAQKNSNIYRWLALHNYQITPGTTDIRGLFNLLDHGRVDAIMLPALTAITLINQDQRNTAQYRIHNHIQLPMGIYISNTYLADHPDFMLKLNQAIKNYQNDMKSAANNNVDIVAPKK